MIETKAVGPFGARGSGKTIELSDFRKLISTTGCISPRTELIISGRRCKVLVTKNNVDVMGALTNVLAFRECHAQPPTPIIRSGFFSLTVSSDLIRWKTFPGASRGLSRYSTAAHSPSSATMSVSVDSRGWRPADRPSSTNRTVHLDSPRF